VTRLRRASTRQADGIRGNIEHSTFNAQHPMRANLRPSAVKKGSAWFAFFAIFEDEEECNPFSSQTSAFSVQPSAFLLTYHHIKIRLFLICVGEGF
jgi:hypothetical protein